MRHIVQQAPLPVHGCLQTVGHTIEIAPKVGEFIVARTDCRRNPRVKISAGHGVEGCPQATYGSRNIPGQGQGRRQARRQSREYRNPWWPFARAAFIVGEKTLIGRGVGPIRESHRTPRPRQRRGRCGP